MEKKLTDIYHQYRYYTEYLGRRFLDLDCDVIIVVRGGTLSDIVGRWKIKLKNNNGKI